MPGEIGRLLRRELRRRVLPVLKARCPRDTGQLARSLRVATYGDNGAVIGALYPRYRQGQSHRHPGVYGYILDRGIDAGERRTKGKRFRHKGNLRYKGWFSDATARLVPRVVRRVARRAAEIRAKGE